MQSSILFGLSTNASAITQQVPTECSSGNCKWTEYLSLAMCSSCVDITDKISTFRNRSWPMLESWPNDNSIAELDIMTTHFLPNGQTIGNLDIWDYDIDEGPLEMTIKNTARPSESLTFKSTVNLIQAVSILRANFSGNLFQNWTSVPVSASECALYFCVNAYHSEIKNGTLVEQWKEVPSTRDPASYQILAGELNVINAPVTGPTNWAPNASADALFEWKNWFPRSDIQLQLPPQPILTNNITTVNISQAAVDSISVYLIDIFSNGTSSWFDKFGCTGAARASRNITNPNRYEPPSMQALASTPSLNTTFFNLAASISANMRGSSDNQLKATGQLGTYETFIKVRWYWIALPCVCICLGTVFLLVVIWETKKGSLPIWKGSIFAVLTHGLEDVAMRSMEHEALISQIEKSAKEMPVTLREKFKLERADNVAMSSGTDYQNREAHPPPRIDFQTRHSSLFTTQEMQTLATTGLLHQRDA